MNNKPEEAAETQQSPTTRTDGHALSWPGVCGNGYKAALTTISPTENKWDLFMLEMREWDPEAFWDRVYAAVEAGKLAISETKKHCLGDEPLLPSHND